MSSLLNNKDLAEIDFNDIEELFAKLTPEEIQLLSDEVDPDVCLILPFTTMGIIPGTFSHFLSISYQINDDWI